MTHSSAGLDPATHHRDDSLLGQHIECFADLSVGEHQRLGFVVPLCGCGRDLHWTGRYWSCGEGACEQSSDAGHAAIVHSRQLDRGVEQKSGETFDHHQFGDERGFGSFIHDNLRRLKAVIKSAFERGVQ